MQARAFPSRINDQVRQQLRSLRGNGAFDVLFAGSVEGDGIHLREFAGTRSGVVRGLVIGAGLGAGGRALVEHRPVRVDGYRTAQSITHDYLHQITREGIHSLVASPISVRGKPRGVLYGALRRSPVLGDRLPKALETSARSLGFELAVQEEVDLRIGAMSNELAGQGAVRSLRESESLTESYLELREIAESVADPGLQERLRRVRDSIRRLPEPASPSDTGLTAREIDVVLYAGIGCSNAEIGERLGLSAATVKTYMRNLMAKLGVGSRHAAVVEARRRGVIP